MLLNRSTNKIVNRPGFSTNISSNKRIADKPGMYNANNKPMESWQLKSRKTDSNDWKHDKQIFDAEREPHGHYMLQLVHML